MAPVQKVNIKSRLKERIQALNISFAELSEISGYKPKTLYNVSSNQQPMTAQLDAYLKLLEVLQKRGELVEVIRELKMPG